MDKLLICILAFLAVVVISNPIANPIANMYGPDFLLFYAFVIGITLVICWCNVRYLDPPTQVALPLIPTKPDPYEIAYLRGGENEVTRLAIFDLIQRGYLQIAGDYIEKAHDQPHPSNLSAIERDVFSWFSSPRKAREIFQLSLPLSVKQHCTIYEQRLQNEKLLLPDELKRIAERVNWIGILIILGLGGYKLSVALVNGRFNVVFLIIMGFISLVLLGIVSNPPRLSHRGRAYLYLIQQTFAGLKGQVSSAAPNSTDLSLMLPVAVFGVGMLAGTPYGDFEQMFHRSTTTSSGTGCGGSCGGGDGGGDGGGGCGGCGGCGGGCGG